MSNSLTEVDAKGEIQPDLAESFEAADGAKRWIFKIRKGATFHDGKTVTPEDVIASIQHHRGADTKSAAKSLLETVTDIKADGPDTVTFMLKEGNADFPYVVSDYHMPIMPAKDGKADWQSGVRTGPFTFVDFQPGISAKLKKNPNYYKSGKPYLDEVEFLAITDVVARTNALMAGEVDYIGRADLKTLDMLKANPDIDVIEVAGYGHYTLPMNVTIAPFDNKDVRLAIKWAINRKEIADKIFLGHATVANDNPLAPSIKYAINPEPVFEFNPEKAKEHLKKAGSTSCRSTSPYRMRPSRALSMRPRSSANRPPSAGSTSTSCVSRRIPTGTMCGSRSPGAPPTGQAGPRRTGCSPRPMPRVLPGTTPTGTTRASTNS